MRRIKHFEVLDKIGQGGFAVVYRARDTRLGRAVAIKELRPDIVADAAARRRIVAEAKAVACLSHPGIVTLHDILSDRGSVVLVMEHMPGRTLEDRLRGGPLGSDEAIRVGAEIAAAIAHAHQGGVVHRDLKPSNLMLLPEGRVKVMDFGLARILPAMPLLDSGRERDGATSFLAGTPEYMAPEQVRGLPADSRSDIFALSVVLFEAACGQRPFGGRTFAQLARAIVEENPFETRRRSFEPGLEAVLVRGLAKEPAERYQEMRHLARDLEALQARAAPVAVVAAPAADIVGRSRELGLLAELVRRAVAPGGRGHTALLSGEAGIGKTTVVEELLRLTKLRSPMPIGSAGFREGRPGFEPLAEALLAVLPEAGNEADDAIRANLAGLLARATTGAMPFAELLDRAMAAAARRGPFAIALENIHQASADALAALRAAARAAPAARAVLVMTYRSEERATSGGLGLRAFLLWLSSEGLATEIALERFSRERTAALVGRILGPRAALAEPLVDYVQKETEGNPLFVVETLRYLRVTARVSAGGDLAPDSGPVLLGRVRDVLGRRLEALAAAPRRLLEIAAVEGEVFHSATIAQVGGLDQGQVVEALEVLVRQHALVVAEAEPGRYRFSHAKIREVVEEALLPERRSEIHRELAQLLEGETPGNAAEIARHLAGAGRRVDAVPHLLRAARAADGQAATDEARRLYATAAETLAETGAAGSRDYLLMMNELGRLQKLCGRIGEARATFARVATLATAHDRIRGTATHNLGWLALWDGDVARARRHFELARGSFDAAGDRIWVAASHDALAVTHRHLGRLAEALREARRALALRRRLRFGWGIALSHINLGGIYFAMGRYRKAVGCWEETLAQLRRHKKTAEVREKRASALSNIAAALGCLGELERALAAEAEALAIRREMGGSRYEAHSLVNIALVHATAGLRQTARDGYERAVRLAAAGGDRVTRAEALLGLGRLAVSEHRTADGLALLGEALDVGHAAGSVDTEGLILIALMHARIGAGELGEADRASARLRSLERGGGLERLAAPIAHVRARLLAARGARPRAIAALRRAVELVRKRPEPELQWRIHRDLGLLLVDRAATAARGRRHIGSALRTVRRVAGGIRDARLREAYESAPERAALLAGRVGVVAELLTRSVELPTPSVELPTPSVELDERPDERPTRETLP